MPDGSSVALPPAARRLIEIRKHLCFWKCDVRHPRSYGVDEPPPGTFQALSTFWANRPHLPTSRLSTHPIKNISSACDPSHYLPGLAYRRAPFVCRTALEAIQLNRIRSGAWHRCPLERGCPRIITERSAPGRRKLLWRGKTSMRLYTRAYGSRHECLFPAQMNPLTSGM